MKKKLTYLFAVVAIIAASCKPSTSCCDIDPNSGKPGSGETDTVAVDIAKEYVKNYAAHAGVVVDSTKSDTLGGVKKPDTRSIWFSEERLCKMLAQIKKNKGDGIRFYLITYKNHYGPEDHVKYHPIPPREYWGYNSLIMVSTKDSVAPDGKKYHRDYFRSSRKDGDKDGMIMNVPPENRGELCPPPSDCFSIGALLLNN